MKTAVKMVVLACLAVTSGPFPLHAEGEGKAIHDRHCLRCHGTEMYQRSDLFVKSYRQLDAQVQHWLDTEHIVLSEEEKDAVLDYLSEEFYGFE